MPQPLHPPAGPQSIGQVLDSGFRIFNVSLVRCLLYGAVSMIAGQLPNIVFMASGLPLPPSGAYRPLWAILYLVGAIIMLLMYAAILLRQHGIAAGSRLAAGAELSRALQRLPAYLALTLLMLVIMAPFLGGAAYAAWQRNAAGAVVATLLLVAVTYVFTPLMCAPTAVLLDDKGPLASLAYVMRLIRGSWWRTTTIFVVSVVLVLVFYAIGMVIVGLVLPLAGATDVAAVTAATGVVSVVLGSVALPFLSAVQLAVYGELKVRREGLDLERRVAEIA